MLRCYHDVVSLCACGCFMFYLRLCIVSWKGWAGRCGCKYALRNVVSLCIVSHAKWQWMNMINEYLDGNMNSWPPWANFQRTTQSFFKNSYKTKFPCNMTRSLPKYKTPCKSMFPSESLDLQSWSWLVVCQGAWEQTFRNMFRSICQDVFFYFSRRRTQTIHRFTPQGVLIILSPNRTQTPRYTPPK